MKDYTKADPAFSQKIKILETTDPSYADNVNAATKQLLENTLYNRESIEHLEESVGVESALYSTGTSYHVGDFCCYQNVLYKCIKDTTGDWDTKCWQKTNPLDEIESLRKTLDALSAIMKGATESVAGNAGLVPAPAAGAQGKFLRGDGTWQTPPDTNTTYGAATQSAPGLMSAEDKKKMDGVATNANAYVHPTTAGNKHIPSGGATGQILRWSADGTAVWGADNNTTYSAATQSADGLMSSADKKKVDGFKGIANNDTTTETGFAWDATRGKAIRDDLNALNSALKPGEIVIRTIGVGYEGEIYAFYPLPVKYDKKPTVTGMAGAVTGFALSDDCKVVLDTDRTNAYALGFKITSTKGTTVVTNRPYICLLRFTVS